MKKSFYYADANSQAVGPLSLEEIRRFADAGIIPPDVMICEEDGEVWKPLSSFEAPTDPSGFRSPRKPVPALSMPTPREKPSHRTLELTDSGKTPKALLWGCNVAAPTLIGIGIAIFALVKIVRSLAAH